MIWALRLLGIGKSLLSGVRSAFRWLFSDIHRVIIAALLVAVAWCWIGWGAATKQSEKRLSDLTAAKQTITDMEIANRKATLFAEAEKRRIETENERKAAYAKRDYEARLVEYDSNLSRWMRNNANRASKTDMPRPSESPSGPTTAGGEAVIPDRYLVTGRDLELTAEAFAKLEALQSWAKSVEVTTPPQ